MNFYPLKGKLPNLLLLLFFLLALPVTLSLLSFKQEPRKQASEITPPSVQKPDREYPPTIINNLVQINLTSKTVLLSWSTDFPTTSFVAYGDISTGFDSVDPTEWGKWRIHIDNSQDTLKTNHQVVINGLNPQGTYYYKVSGISKPETGKWIANSPLNSFVTTPVPSIYSGPQIINIGQNEATVTWITNYPITTFLAYSDISTGFGSNNQNQWGKWRIAKDNLVDDYQSMKGVHTVRLMNLTSNKTYYIRVGGWDFPPDTGSFVFSSLKSFATR